MNIRTRIAHSIKKKIKIENMRFFLVGITNGSARLYHIAYVKENGEKKFVEMRRRKTTKKAFQLKCSKSRSCNAILYISFKPPIRGKKSLWIFSELELSTIATTGYVC